jgi:putative ABC transport system permease protein
MPPGFWFPSRGVDVWRPLRIDQPRDVDIVGRLQPGRSWSDVQAELNVLASTRTLVRSFQQEARIKVGPGLQALIAPAIVILLIACLNVANLLVMRALDRDRELAIRSALGATPLRLARLTVVDATILGAAAGGGGLLLASWGIAGLQVAGASALPALAGAVRPYLVAAIAAGAAAVTILAVALLPAFRAARMDLRAAFAGGLRQPVFRRLGYGVGDVVLVLQVALAVVLVVVSAFNLRLFGEAVRVSRLPGGDRVRVARVSAASDISEAGRTTLFAAVLDEVRRSGGIEASAIATSLPELGQPRSEVTVTGARGATASCRVKVAYVTTEFFDTLGMTFRTRLPGPGVSAVASESGAARCFPSGVQGSSAVRVSSDGGAWIPVTGVVADPFTSKMPGTTDMASYLWVVGAQRWPSNVLVIVRSAASHSSLRTRNGIAVDAFTTYDERVGPSAAEMGLLVGVLGGTSLLALLLAFTGVYAAMSQSCQSRIVELGIRLALGAPPVRLVVLAVARDVPLVAAGVVTGVVGTVWVTAIVWRDLLVFNALDLRVWVVVTSVLAGAALLASLGPALRALKVDPMTVLRAE